MCSLSVNLQLKMKELKSLATAAKVRLWIYFYFAKGQKNFKVLFAAKYWLVKTFYLLNELRCHLTSSNHK